MIRLNVFHQAGDISSRKLSQNVTTSAPEKMTSPTNAMYVPLQYLPFPYTMEYLDRACVFRMEGRDPGWRDGWGKKIMTVPRLIGDVAVITDGEFLGLKAFSKKKLQELKGALAVYGLTTGMEFEAKHDWELFIRRADTPPPEAGVVDSLDPVLFAPMNELSLSVQAQRSLAEEGVNYAGQLAMRSPRMIGANYDKAYALRRVPLKSVESALATLGLKVGSWFGVTEEQFLTIAQERL